MSVAHQSLLQQGIAEEVLRFHVLANSDSEEDQRVKYLVRDAVIAWLANAMESDENTDTEETGTDDKTNQTEAQIGSETSGNDAGEAADDRAQMAAFLEHHLIDLEQAADQVLEREGVSYRSEAALESCWFPERTYGACTFPAGFYDALRLKLGEAEGQNWWCVLYPRLCFLDCVHAVVEDEQMEQLEEVLTEEEYEMLLEEPSGWKIAFRWF